MTAAVPPRARSTDQIHRAASPLPVWPAVLLFYAILAPPEISFEIGSLRFFMFRVALFICLPAVVLQLASGKVRLGLVDVLIFLGGGWIVVTMVYHLGLGPGLESGGATSFDLIASYLVGRCFLGTLSNLQRFLSAIAPGIAIEGLLMMAESVGGRPFVRPFLARVLEAVERDWFGTEPRFGFVRAYGTFPHPILAGLIMSSFLPLFLLCARRGWLRYTGLMGSGLGIFSWSSAALMGFGLNLGFATYDKMRRVARAINWPLFLAGCAFLAAILQIATTGGPIKAIIKYLTFSPRTGYYRLLIWDYGTANVANNPIFGLGMGDWVRPRWMSDSVDNHWLLLAMRFGLPAVTFLGLASVLTIIKLSNQVRRSPTRSVRDAHLGVVFAIAVLTLLMFTVAVWNNSFAWYNLLLGGSATMCAARLPRKRSVPRPITGHATDHRGINPSPIGTRSQSTFFR